MKATLDPEAVARYWRDGFAVARGALPPAEVVGLAEECARLDRALDRAALCGPMVTPRRGADGRAFFDRLDPASTWSPRFAALLTDSRLIGPVAALLGDAPRPFKDKILWKPPGSGGYALHTDYDYWPRLGAPADATLTAILAIDAAPPESGAIEVFPGLHRVRLPAAPGDPLDLDPAAVAEVPSALASIEPGDLLLLHSALPHRSGANRTGADRRAFFVSYGAARFGDLRESYARGRGVGAAERGLTAPPPAADA